MVSPEQFVHQDDGAVAIEYVLIASVTAVAILSGLPFVGPVLNDLCAALVAVLDVS